MKFAIPWMFFALCAISCSSVVDQPDLSRLRFPAGQSIDDEWSQMPFEKRLNAALMLFHSAFEKMDHGANPRRNLYKHFNRRAKALWGIVVEDQDSAGARKEKEWFPKKPSPVLEFRVKQILGYRQVVKEAEDQVEKSILQPKDSEEALTDLRNADSILLQIARGLPEERRRFLTDTLLVTARADLIATLAGQVYRNVSVFFPKEGGGIRIRSILSKLSKLPRLSTPDQLDPKVTAEKLGATVTSRDFSYTARVFRRISLPEVQDIDGGDEALDLAILFQTNFEVIEGMTASMRRSPAQDEEEAAPPKKKSVKKAPVPEPVVLFGWIPGRYLSKPKGTTVFGAIEIENRVIKSIKAVDESKVDAAVKTLGAKKSVVLKDEVLYPGLINLHNHTKQNNLSVWKDARGQFENRFEWRAWGIYEKTVSGNMNPWIGFGDATECAAFRWSELQAMVWGTTYLQGPSTCVSQFGIQRVEETDAFVTKLTGVQAPTDLIYPNEMSFVWNELGPQIVKLQAKGDKLAYERALADEVNRLCPGLPDIKAETVNEASGLKILKDQKLLKEKCKGDLDSHFIRYVYFIHPTIAGKKKYIQTPGHSAIIAHLAEGRREDPYNKKEFELVKLLGLDQPNVNFIHGVGIDAKGFARMKEREMGLIWSPFSNLLLYSETLDIEQAQKAGVRIALGSDWLPTGSKGVLEEVKLARSYVKKMGLDKTFTDEALYNMMTENPARMINHWKVGAGEAGIGQLTEGAMGTVIAVKKNVADPYTNLVAIAEEKDVNLVVIDGQPLYGNQDYLKELGENNVETMSEEIVNAKATLDKAKVPPPGEEDDADTMERHLVDLGKRAAAIKWTTEDLCAFKPLKGLVQQNSASVETDVADFKKATGNGLDLDRFTDIEKLIAINLITQSKNAALEEGDAAYAVTEFPPLYSCNDKKHQDRFSNFVKDKGDELEKNRDEREGLRTKGKLGRVPKTLADLYAKPIQ